LDEADQLLEMGFRPDIERILAMLGPMAGRQTLLFSATVPDGVHKVSQLAMKKDHKYIDCIDPSEEVTNIQVDQTKHIVPFEQRVFALVQLLHTARANPAAKVIVFFSTARECGFIAEFCNQIGIGIPVMEIHSRKSQGHRTKTADQFKAARTAVLFSSDVSARGMDYPDVTDVIQVGITTKEQYIHRLGRTARAGKSGQGCILLVPFEQKHMDRELRSLPLVVGKVIAIHPDIQYKVQTAISKVPTNSQLFKSAEQCYQAWLGFHNSNLRALGWNQTQLVQMANRYSLLIGCREPPALEKRTVGKMGLKGVPGIRFK
jgi:ATP-dependent RNA helicase MSS116